MEEYQEIIIDWKSKIPISGIKDFIEIANEIKSSKILYKIYGDHHIYGRDVLLYIGITEKAQSRFSAHLKGVFNFVNNKSISLGETDEGIKRLEIPESILIANHKPAFNKEYIHSLDSRAMDHKIIIINNGDNGDLKTSCTNFWWVNE